MAARSKNSAVKTKWPSYAAFGPEYSNGGDLPSWMILLRASANAMNHCSRSVIGCVATFNNQQESDWLGRPGSLSCGHLEQLVDELNLLPNIRTAHPPRLTLPDHVHCLISLDRSPRRVEFTKALLGFHSSFDRPDDPAPGCCSSIGPAGGGNGVAGFLPASLPEIAAP